MLLHGGLRAAAWLILVAVLLVVLGERWPTGHWEGGPIHPRGADPSHRRSPPSRLRLASFNIHSGIGLDKRWDVGRTAELLRGYDLVGLHEVRAAGPWWDNNANEISDRLGVQSLFAPTEIWMGRPWFGNGVLTTTTIAHWQQNRLPSGYRDAYRQVLQLSVPFGKGNLNVLIAHLGKNDNRRKQFPIVADMFLKLPSPAVLMGDFNTRPWDPMMEKLLREPGIEDPVDKRVLKLRDRVEFILLKGVSWRDAGLVENQASDHPVIWVEIEVP